MSSFPPKMAATVSKSSFPVSKTSIRLFLWLANAQLSFKGEVDIPAEATLRPRFMIV
jgi:hypothetical protein